MNKQQNQTVYKVTLSNSDGFNATYQVYTLETARVLIDTFREDCERAKVKYVATYEVIE